MEVKARAHNYWLVGNDADSERYISDAVETGPTSGGHEPGEVSGVFGCESYVDSICFARIGPRRW